MKKCHSFCCLLAIAALYMLPAALLEAAETAYSEDFLTRQYCDNIHTTAWWDTLSGELKLYPAGVTLAGILVTPGWAWHVEIEGNYAYVTDDYAGLEVIDITDPTNPVLVGNCDTPGDAKVVAIAGDFAFVADGGAGLTVVDIRNPEMPVLVTTHSTPSLAIGITIAGDYAYVGDMESGLVIFDISVPSNPICIGVFDTPGFALHVTTCGNYVYVADGDRGLQVFDITDPTSPWPAGSIDTPGTAFDVAISGDFAYVGDGDSGLQVIDISDPTYPQLVATYDTPYDAYGVAISGDYACVADFRDGYPGSIHVIDISEPSDPQPGGYYYWAGLPHGVTISGNYAYVGDYAGLRVFKLSDPVPPSLAWVNISPYYNWDVAVSGDYAYVAGDTSGLKVIDIKDHTIMGLAGSCDTPDHAVAVAVDGDYAYVADRDSGLQVIDISNPEAPVLVGNCGVPCHTFVRIHGDFLFSLGYNEHYAPALLIIDISDPIAPDTLSTYEIDGVTDMAIAGDHAYLTSYGIYGGVKVLDIQDPTNPQLIGESSAPWFAMGIVISGDYAYVASLWESSVMDISDPTNPTVVGSFCGSSPCSEPTWDHGIAISGDYVCTVDDSASGFEMYDISDPIHPSFMGMSEIPPGNKRIITDGDYAYVSHYIIGLVALRIFDRNFDASHNVGQSLVIDQSEEPVRYVKLSTTQIGTIGWEISADNGENWQGVTPGSGWEVVDAYGSDLKWRSTHLSGGGSVNPTCYNLQIEWLYDSPVIDQVTDAPGDQGLEVKITWSRSALDNALVTGYEIYRLMEPMLQSGPPSVESEQSGPGLRGDECVLEKSFSTLEGDWEYIKTITAAGQDRYTTEAPTIKDSTVVEGMYNSIFYVRAVTPAPDFYFDSAPDSGYSIDNISPPVPGAFTVVYNAGAGRQLSWDPCPHEDLLHYNIYNGMTEEFVPAPENLICTTSETSWLDECEREFPGHYYKITAVDDAWNESDPSSPESTTGIEDPVVPKVFALHQNVPNPFNPVTRIRFDLPRCSDVKLCIYNIKGELVSILVDRQMTGGSKEVIWDARDRSGRAVSSGIYFYRLVAGGFVETKKMVLLR